MATVCGVDDVVSVEDVSVEVTVGRVSTGTVTKETGLRVPGVVVVVPDVVAEGRGSMGTVTTGLNAQVVKPEAGVGARFGRFAVIAHPVTVHGTVKVDSGDSVAVGSEDVLERGHIVHGGGTFIVNDDIVALGVIGIPIELQGWVG